MSQPARKTPYVRRGKVTVRLSYDAWQAAIDPLQRAEHTYTAEIIRLALMKADRLYHARMRKLVAEGKRKAAVGRAQARARARASK